MNKLLLPIIALALLLTGCFGQRSSRDEVLNTETIRYPMPEGGKVLYGEHGEEQWFAYGAMNGVEGVPANGVTQFHYFEDGLYLHTIQLNIDPAQDGYFYEGWLVEGSSVISTGHLNNNFGDARHNLRFEEQTDYRDHLQVIVTLEPDDGDPAPAGHVAAGVLKVTERPQ